MAEEIREEMLLREIREARERQLLEDQRNRQADLVRIR